MPHREDRCRQKVDYTTRRKAKAAAKAMELKHRGERFNVYRCTVCPCWHVGHMPVEKLRDRGWIR